MTKNRKNRVLICGAYGSGNLGDESILDAIVDDVRSIDPQADIGVITWNHIETSQRLSVRAIPASVTSALRAVLEHDIVLCGGGAILGEYGRGKALIHTLKGLPGYPLTMITWAHLLAKPSMIYAAGVEEIQVRLFRYWLQLACRFPRVITVRDPRSADLLRKWGVSKSNINVTADPVFGLSIPSCKRVGTPRSSTLTVSGEGPTVGIGVCFEPQFHVTNVETIINFYSELVDWLIYSKDSYVILIPMSTDPSFDLAVMTAIRNQVEHPDRTLLLQGLTRPEQIHQYVGCLDLVISSRMHLLIFAALKYIPLIATSRTIKSDSKLDSLMHRLGQGPTIPLNSSGLARTRARIDELLSDVPSVRGVLKERVTVLQALARQNRQLLAGLLTVR